jgi:nucleotide-binding universal stress UspA family protein
MNETVNVNQDQDSLTPRARKVVVGVDGSQSSVAALREGARLAAERGDAVVAVAAWHMPISYGGFPTGWYPEVDAKSTLDAAAKAAFGDGVPAGYSQLVLEGLPAHVLLQESRDADFLVVGSRGHGGFAGLLLGSVSQACAEYATCPVLIIHGDVGSVPKVRAESSLAATH